MVLQCKNALLWIEAETGVTESVEYLCQILQVLVECCADDDYVVEIYEDVVRVSGSCLVASETWRARNRVRMA